MTKRTSSKETMSNIFNSYVWLTDLIYRRRKITIEAMFDINIECNRKGGYYYYIENADDVKRGGVRQWLREDIKNTITKQLSRYE